MAVGSDDPTGIDVIVVTAADVVAALEARRQRSRPVVLRVTPPFSARMRARLHVETGVDDALADPAPLHLEPEQFFDDPPPRPRPDDTAEEIRDGPDREYTVEAHHEHHRSALDAWREDLRDHFVSETTFDDLGGDRPVDVAILE